MCFAFGQGRLPGKVYWIAAKPSTEVVGVWDAGNKAASVAALRAPASTWAG